MSKIPQIIYTVACITDIYISRFLYTLYKFSEPGSFRVIVMDETKNGFRPEVMNYVKSLIHLYIHPCRNLGYAKAHNEMILHGLHWKTPYICLANDDIEIMNKRWIQGIWDTFALDPQRIMGVSPMNPRIPGWGYGVSYNPELLPYKEEYTEEEYQYLLDGDFSHCSSVLPDSFPRNQKGSIIDGSIFIMPYFKREMFEKFGLLDERFWPGSGEDMDMMARVYREDGRIVSTSLSWVWHHVTKSKDLFASGELEDKYYKNREYWNEMGDLWPPELNEGHGHDPWGVYKSISGIKRKLIRVPEVFIDQI